MARRSGHVLSYSTQRVPLVKAARNPPRPGVLATALHWPWRDSRQDDPKLIGLLRAGFRMAFIFVREFQRDSIPLRASALTFTIVLSLVPILALGTAVLKGLGSGDEMRQTAYRFLDQLDSGGAGIAGGGSEPMVAPTDGKAGARPTEQQMSGHLRRATDQIFAAVDRTNFSALGAFGVLGLLLGVLGVLVSIETALNNIWQAKKGRPLSRRLMDSLACTILLPLSINLAFATGAVLHNQSLLRMIHNTASLAWLSGTLIRFLPFVLLIATFTVLYRFLPNTQVRFWPAFVGGLVGGISWVVVQTLYVSTQIAVVRFNAIYGSFATIPLFLLWLYLAWIVFLAGAEAAFVVQVWRHYDWLDEDATPIKRLSLAFRVLQAMAEDGRARRVSSPETLMLTLSAPCQTDILTVLALLEQGKLVRQVADKAGYLLAGPIDTIKAKEVLLLILGNPTDHQTHPLAREAILAAANHLSDHGLRSANEDDGLTYALGNKF